MVDVEIAFEFLARQSCMATVCKLQTYVWLTLRLCYTRRIVSYRDILCDIESIVSYRFPFGPYMPTLLAAMI